MLEDLFDKRGIVGARLEKIFEEKGYTKATICKESGVSRPTMDKILSGTLTNKTNYEKHMQKLCNYLKLSPDALIGNGINRANKTRQLRNAMNITSETLAKRTGISIERLKLIESGAAASTAELRDVALCLGVSVNVLQGMNFFEPQIAQSEFHSGVYGTEELELNGFWGHVGILLNNRKEYLWYPITESTRNHILSSMENERLVMPCMNNKVLYLYMPNVKEIILNSFDCDTPEYVNWNPNVDCGEIPLVIYDAMEDYVVMDQNCIETELISKEFMCYLSQLINQKKWTESEMHEVMDGTVVYYNDGTIRHLSVNFGNGFETLSGEISIIYDFGKTEVADNVILVTDYQDSEIVINLKNVSMIQSPLIQVENAICSEFD